MGTGSLHPCPPRPATPTALSRSACSSQSPREHGWTVIAQAKEPHPGGCGPSSQGVDGLVRRAAHTLAQGSVVTSVLLQVRISEKGELGEVIRGLGSDERKLGLQGGWSRLGHRRLCHMHAVGKYGLNTLCARYQGSSVHDTHRHPGP